MTVFKKTQTSEDVRPVFIDLAEFRVTDVSKDKRIKVIRPTESGDLRSIKGYILAKIALVIDFSSYTGDQTIAANIVRDAVSECGGDVFTINPTTILAAPYDVDIDDRDQR